MNQPLVADMAPSISLKSFPPVLRTIRDFFVSKETDAYLVGGAVRDALLERPVADLDIAIVSLLTKEVVGELSAFIGGRVVVLDEERNIIRVVITGTEVCAVDINSAPSGILEDLSRRDFTINAMAIALDYPDSHTDTLRVIDPYKGFDDLKEKRLKAINTSVFEDDPLRLLRAPRLAAQLNIDISTETLTAIKNHASLINHVARERVRDEFLKILAEPKVAERLYQLDEMGLLTQIIPELDAARGIEQPREHFWDVFEHSIETAGFAERLVLDTSIDNMPEIKAAPRFHSINAYFSSEASDGYSRLTLLKLAGLLHDIGKPHVKTVENDGRIRFLGHAHFGSELVSDILIRLRLSRRGVDHIKLMVDQHLRPGQLSNQGLPPSRKAVFRYFRDLGEVAVDTIYLHLADYLAARGPLLNRQEWNRHCLMIESVLQESINLQQIRSMPKLIDGYHLMSEFSLQPGPLIGQLLDLVAEAQTEGAVKTKEEALELVKSYLKRGGRSA